MKPTITFILQNKGGIGKSHISWLLANYLMKTNDLKVYDNDSETPRMITYECLNAEHIQLFKLDNNGYVKPESLNLEKLNILSQALESGDNENILVDCGSPSFQPTLSFFQADIMQLYIDTGVKFRIVIPIGKEPVTQTAPAEILAAFGDLAEYILIENEFFGEFDFDDKIFKKEGVKYAKMKMEPLQSLQLKAVDLAKENNLLLDEAITSPLFNIPHKGRLNQVKYNFESVIDNIITDFNNEEL